MTAEAAESELWIEEREFRTVKPKSQLQEARSQNREFRTVKPESLPKEPLD